MLVKNLLTLLLAGLAVVAATNSSSSSSESDTTAGSSSSSSDTAAAGSSSSSATNGTGDAGGSPSATSATAGGSPSATSATTGGSPSATSATTGGSPSATSATTGGGGATSSATGGGGGGGGGATSSATGGGGGGGGGGATSSATGGGGANMTTDTDTNVVAKKEYKSEAAIGVKIDFGATPLEDINGDKALLTAFGLAIIETAGVAGRVNIISIVERSRRQLSGNGTAGGAKEYIVNFEVFAATEAAVTAVKAGLKATLTGDAKAFSAKVSAKIASSGSSLVSSITVDTTYEVTPASIEASFANPAEAVWLTSGTWSLGLYSEKTCSTLKESSTVATAAIGACASFKDADGTDQTLWLEQCILGGDAPVSNAACTATPSYAAGGLPTSGKCVNTGAGKWMKFTCTAGGGAEASSASSKDMLGLGFGILVGFAVLI